MNNSKLILIASIFLLVFSCRKEAPKDEKPMPKPVNYMVLLDLSDRILCQGQASRDIEIIKTVFDEFETKVRRNLVINSRDKFQVIIAPQKNIPYNAQEFENALFIDMGGINSGKRIDMLVEFRNNLAFRIKELYTAAYLGDKTSDYPGAGIWQFFNGNLEYLVGDEYENNLVVITDGYFDLEDYSKQIPAGNRFPTTSFLASVRSKSNWREILEENDMGLLPVHKDFKDLTVMVSELSPKYDFQYEADMLAYVWLKWCKEMNTATSRIVAKSSLPQTLTLIKNKLASNY